MFHNFSYSIFKYMQTLFSVIHLHSKKWYKNFSSSKLISPKAQDWHREGHNWTRKRSGDTYLLRHILGSSRGMYCDIDSASNAAKNCLVAWDDANLTWLQLSARPEARCLANCMPKMSIESASLSGFSSDPVTIAALLIILSQ